MSYSHCTDAWLINSGNFIENDMVYKIDLSSDLNDIDQELESRAPVFEREYDATGQIITSEVMGYTEEGEEIWS